MPTKKALPEPRLAIQGERMIGLRVRFFTDGLAKERGYVLPLHALTKGTVSIEANESHGITPSNPAKFNSLAEIGTAIEAVLIAHGVVLHPHGKMASYVSLSS